MHCSNKCLCIIKEFEGCRLKAYKCPAGKWTIGYGWTHGVHPGDVWTQEQAEDMLTHGVVPYEQQVIKTCPKVTQNQFDAMVSLCYNIGPANFATSSVAKLHNAGNHSAAADAFLRWNKGRVRGKLTVLEGLNRRRHAERKLYLEA